MAGHDFTSAARSLALPIDDSDGDDILPTQTRNHGEQRRQTRQNTGDSARPRTTRDKWVQNAEKWNRRATQLWSRLTPLQKGGIITLNVVLFVMTVLFLVYSERIFSWFAGTAKSWRSINGGWLILWFMTFFVSFPPMIGYSTCVTIAGFVYGMKGWFIMSTATIIGSTCAFIVSRGVLRSFVSRLTEKNKRFAALSLVLKHDGLKLLVMIRLCPLPYSLSNGAISTIPTVTWYNFAIATAIASPKLLLHIFVGSRLGDLAENGDKMDTKTKVVSYVSILIGITAGIATGYLVYVRTKARARELEAEEEDAAISGHRRSSSGTGNRPEFSDDPDEQAAIDFLRRSEDDISLRNQTFEDDLESGGQYRDEFTDDEDAPERDVFDIGDGYESEETNGKKGER